MGQEYAGLTYCTDFNDASAHLPPSMKCLVHNSHCEGGTEGQCGPNCPRYTTHGCECARNWAASGHECRDSCCNPTGTTAWDWCMVKDPSCQGMAWGPCAAAEKPAPPQRKTSKGCKCANGWSVNVEGGVQHCYDFCCSPPGLDLGGEVCVVQDEACEGQRIGRCRPPH
ncbi:unnamed protein product [Effrenium voratum]|nr:unnamed protein product [Effrenium voratum]